MKDLFLSDYLSRDDSVNNIEIQGEFWKIMIAIVIHYGFQLTDLIATPDDSFIDCNSLLDF